MHVMLSPREQPGWRGWPIPKRHLAKSESYDLAVRPRSSRWKPWVRDVRIRIVLIGTADLAVPAREALLAEHEVVCVYTRPPRRERLPPVAARAEPLGLARGSHPPNINLGSQVTRSGNSNTRNTARIWQPTNGTMPL